MNKNRILHQRAQPIAWLDALLEGEQLTKLKYTTQAEETALIRLERLADADNDMVKARFIDLERAQSCETQLRKDAELWNWLDANGSTCIGRVRLELRIGNVLREYHNSVYIYPELPEYNRAQLLKYVKASKQWRLTYYLCFATILLPLLMVLWLCILICNMGSI